MIARSTRLLFMLLFLAAVLPATAQVDHDHDHHEETGQERRAQCGTMIWMQYQNGGGRDPKLNRLLSSIRCNGARPIKGNSILTDQLHFRIHYDTFGEDSVSVTDRNNNSIPDYIDSVAYYLEDAWTRETGEYGFAPPPPDNRGPGPEIDVFVCNLAGEVYGFAQPETDLPTGPNTVSGYLVIDNDYREPYFTQGIKGLRVTLAHEFHHIIQFSRYRFDFSQSSFYEATAVWFERELHPDVKDYSQYTDEFLRIPQEFGLSTHRTYQQGDVTGYAHILYLTYLTTRLNDKQVVRKAWDQFRTQENVFTAIDLALREYGLNLENSFCEFAEWSYYTGVRAQGSKYFLDASSLPTMGSASSKPFDGDDLLLVQGRLYPLGFGLYRFWVTGTGSGARDTVDFLVTNARTDFGKGGAGIAKDLFTLELSRTERSGFRPLRLKDTTETIFFRLNAPSPQFCVNPIIGGTAAVLLATTVAPQPFISDGAAQLIFGVNLAKEQVRNARLVIYSTSMAAVTEINLTELESLNNILGVIWNGTDFRGDLVPSGVYLYEFTINDGTPSFGKIAVIRK